MTEEENETKKKEREFKEEMKTSKEELEVKLDEEEEEEKKILKKADEEKEVPIDEELKIEGLEEEFGKLTPEEEKEVEEEAKIPVEVREAIKVEKEKPREEKEAEYEVKKADEELSKIQEWGFGIYKEKEEKNIFEEAIEGTINKLNPLVNPVIDGIPKVYFTNNKRRIAMVFIVIYLLFGIILGYLLFLNTGLELVETAYTSGDKKLSLINNSIHTIKDVQIIYRAPQKDYKLLQKIETLRPNDKINIDLTKIKDPLIQLVARAPFHIETDKVVKVRSASPIDIQASVAAPQKAIINNEFKALIEACNPTTQTLSPVQISETHMITQYKEQNRVQNITLQPNACGEVEFSFTPKIKGETEIVFNINAEDIIKTQKIIVRVE